MAVAATLYVYVSQIQGGPSVGDIIASITAAIIQLIFVMVLNIVYEFLAYKLTDWGRCIVCVCVCVCVYVCACVCCCVCVPVVQKRMHLNKYNSLIGLSIKID